MAAAVEHVGVDHRGPDATVAQKLLDGANVVAPDEEVRGEGVPKGMAARGFGDAGSRTALLTARWTVLGLM